MYYCWTKQNIRPSVFYSMSKSEVLIIKAFYEQDLKDKSEYIKAGGVCPMMM